MAARIQFFAAFLVFSATALFSADTEYHFFNINRKPIPEYESVYPLLRKYYKDSTIKRITVRYTEKVSSMFNVKNDEIQLNKSADNHELRTAGHESSHLCLANLTNGESVRERSRFFDEGFANIFGSIVDNDMEIYRKEALNIAAEQAAKGNVSFEKVRNWGDYFGKPGVRTNSYAYPVGSSFDFYIIDTYGMEKLFTFFTDIGKTRDLEESLKNVFGTEMKDFEAKWISYVAANKSEGGIPKIIRMFPENGSSGVSTSLEEIFVEFDQPMSRTLTLGTQDCASGVCYKNAYWKSRTVLALKVSLKNDFQYRLNLGNKAAGKHLSSAAGRDLPITEWKFSTGGK